MNKRGISLIILIVTIVISLILLSIVIFNLNNDNVTTKATEVSFKANINTFKNELELYILNKRMELISKGERLDPSTLNINGQDLGNIIPSIKNTPYISMFEIANGNLVYTNTNDYSEQGLKQTEWAQSVLGTVTVGSDVAIDNSTNRIVADRVNKPLIPYSPDNSIKAISYVNNVYQEVSDPSTNTWYYYNSNNTSNNDFWANMKTKDGSYFVWIPRYAYKITKGYHGENLTYGELPIVDVKFLKGSSNIAYDGTTCLKSGDSKNNYIVHPAFTFGGRELSGIWVAKSEAGCRQTIGWYNLSDTNTDTKNVKVAAGQMIWSNISVSNAFSVCRKMESDSNYGWNTDSLNLDTHMLKNVEWGATVLLARSNYGATTPISYQNGQSNAACYSTSYSSTSYSTTKNMSGVFDMAGLFQDMVAAYHSDYISTTTNNNSNLYNADTKYKDVYTLDKGYWYYLIVMTDYYEYGIYDQDGNFVDMGQVYGLENVPQICKDGTYGSYYYRWSDYESGYSATYNDLPEDCKTGANGSGYSEINYPTNKYYGDATYEVSNFNPGYGGYNAQAFTAWFGNSLSMPEKRYPVVVRGGYFGSMSSDGTYNFCSVGIYSSYCTSGEPNSVTTFRPVIITDPGV